MNKVRFQSKIFGTVKAFSLKAKLLSLEDYRTLAESRDMDEFVTRLKNTRYVESISQLQKPYTARGIELALKTDLINYHHNIIRIASNSKVIETYFLRYMIWNLKLILKGKALNKSEEEIRARINLRGEEILGKRDIVVKALISKDLDECVATLTQTGFGKDLQNALKIYKEKNDIQIFDTFLDHYFYDLLSRSIDNGEKEVSELISLELDAYNILSILRSKFWNLSERQIRELVVDGSKTLSKDVLNKMILATDLKEVLSILSNTSYRDNLPQQVSNDIDTINSIERTFENTILKTYLNTYLRVFKEANMLAAIKLKSIEIKNLCAIATGVEQRLDPDIIMKSLTIIKKS